jgi:hypothetical protein
MYSAYLLVSCIVCVSTVEAFNRLYRDELSADMARAAGCILLMVCDGVDNKNDPGVVRRYIV